MATLSAQSEEKDRLNVLMKEKAAFDAKLNSSAKLLQDVNNELTRQLDRVKQLESEYEEAQRKAKPRVGEIFFSAIIDIVKFAPQMISNVMGHRPSGPSGGGQMPSQQPTAGNEQTNEQVDELNNAYKAASGVSEEDRTKMKEQLDEISNQVQSDAAKALAETASNGHTMVLNQRLDTMSESSSDTYGQIMGSRLAKLKAATDMLISANKQYEALFDKKIALMDRNSEYIAKLKVIDFTKIDFEAILEVIREGIFVLGRHIEQWKRFLEFFKIIENLTQLASEQSGLFINGTLQGVKDGALMSVYGNDDIYMDMLYEHSFTTIDIARDDYLKQQQRIKERVDQISCLMDVLKEDPYIKKAIEQNGYDVDIEDF
ncbi:unnamed protein product [Anisakis simplex]|uniref:TelA-like protein n=1 Tax=Anisakis simplex TaxID=6269 RepID=A0A0M3KC08_ANISI|nr:unnamed protein product [Anisakis simplex]